MKDAEPPDWAAWSRDAVSLMTQRNDAWMAKFSVAQGATYRWDLDAAELAFACGEQRVLADLCFVGAVSSHEGTFL
ncbi:MAG TPA: hypothetical protein VHV78_06255 [Gemmatimonadaceae bacterium]|jgi:hypothetical protein|nr:hypothetical protein [Gemmatimonadaceae bacterium]